MKIKTIGNEFFFFDEKDNCLDHASGIRQLRRERKLNTKDFGAMVGASGRTVEGWEQGKRVPAGSTMLLIKNIFKL